MTRTSKPTPAKIKEMDLDEEEDQPLHKCSLDPLDDPRNDDAWQTWIETEKRRRVRCPDVIHSQCSKAKSAS